MPDRPHQSKQPDQSEALEVSYEADMPGTPEQAWEMIATGPGFTMWLTRLEVEERLGGAISVPMGEQSMPMCTITAWEPPHRFGYVENEGRRLAHEFTVEARDGGTSHVRLVYTGFDSRESWEQELEGAGAGWSTAFAMMDACLRYFPGQRGASVQAMHSLPGTRDEAWAAFLSALGFGGPSLRVGVRVTSATSEGPPVLAGEVVHLAEYLTIIKLDAPTPGLAWLGAGYWQGKGTALVHINFFGDDRDAVFAREQPAWEAWLAQTFPALEADTASATA